MKVLTFLTSISLKGGGPSRSVPMLVKGLAEIDVDITLMTFRSEDMNTHALEGTSAKLKILEPGTSTKELETYIVKEDFNLIQMQSLWDLSYHNVARIALKYNIPYIITPRGMLEPWSLRQKWWKKKLALWLYQMNDLKKAACIFTTAEMEACHIRDLGVKVPVSVIPNGIETDGYVCRKGMDSVKKQILFLSRIHVKKGIELLIEAFNRLKSDFPDWKVLIVGNGEDTYIKDLKQLIVDLDLQHCVQILVPVFGKEKIQLYQESSIFCLPSFSENFGMVIAEALSCGVPVVTTTNCPWQILNETKTGWCIDLNVDNLERTLRDVLSLPSDELYMMGQKGSKIVYEQFDYRSVAKKTKALYEWLTGEGPIPEFVKI